MFVDISDIIFDGNFFFVDRFLSYSIVENSSDAVAELRENGFDTSSGSDSEADGNEVASNGSGDTEGKTTSHQFLCVCGCQKPPLSYYVN